MDNTESIVDIDPAVARLLEVVEGLGGANPVARKMGKQAQLFYNMMEGKSKFSLSTIQLLAEAFPSKVDANYILFGFSGFGGISASETAQKPSNNGSDGAVIAAVPVTDEYEVVPRSVLEQMQKVIESQAAQIESQANHIDHLNQQVLSTSNFANGFREIALNFPKSGSHTTAMSILPIGYDYDFTQKQPEAKVAAHPATVANRAKVREMWSPSVRKQG